MTIEGSVGMLGAELAALIPALQPTKAQRYEVVRTSHTDDRAPIPRDARIVVYARDHFRCVWCGAPEPLTLDHFVPWSAGGTDDIDNLRTLCWPCNEKRSNFNFEADRLWKPLPHGFACYNCCSPGEFDDPVAPMFCYWCRKAAVGWPAHLGAS